MKGDESLDLRRREHIYEFEGKQYLRRPEIEPGNCTGCCFWGDFDDETCQHATKTGSHMHCFDFVRIPDTPEGEQEYVAQQARARLGLMDD